MSNYQNEEQACFVTGFVKEAKNSPGTKYVTTAVMSLKEIAELCGSDLVEIAIFDSKKDPAKMKSIKFKKGDPKYLKSLKDFNRGGQSSGQPPRQNSGQPGVPYGTAQSQDDFIP